MPLHASSAGKLILADLDSDELDAWLGSAPLASYTGRTIAAPDELRAELIRVRRQRWAELADELEAGLASISVPVHSPDGIFAGVIGLSGPTFDSGGHGAGRRCPGCSRPRARSSGRSRDAVALCV